MAGTMKAMVFHEPLRMQMEKLSIPKIGSDEVLVRVKACGICGSDISYYYGLSPLETATGRGPLILGHELSGEIVELGSIPKQQGIFKVGDRVTVDPDASCNACTYCKKGQVNFCDNLAGLGVSKNGGFAEYVKSRHTGIFMLPDNVSYQQAAFSEPLACAMYSIRNLEVDLGVFCVIIGPGPIGLIQTQLIKAAGAGTIVVVGTRDYRLEYAREMGADHIINIKDPDSRYFAADLKQKIAILSNGGMADRVLVSTGNPDVMGLPFAISGKGAVIVFFGLPGEEDVVPVPALDTAFGDKRIKFSWLAPLTWPKALGAIATGSVRLDELITHRFKLDELVTAMGKVKKREGNALKAMVIP